MKIKPKFKMKGLRRRWLVNTVSLVCTLGILCVLGITMAFAGYYYGATQSDLEYRAKSASAFFLEHTNVELDDFYKSCIAYTQHFEDRNTVELQFVDAEGWLAASSANAGQRHDPTTSEVKDAMKSLGIRSYIGEDPGTGDRIIAVSSPVIYNDGVVVGVLRFVTSTKTLDTQILRVFMISFSAFLLVTVTIIISGNYYIRTILVPLEQIIEKAKLITGGSYGAQIQTKYDDEIGTLADAINEMSNKINENEKAQTEFISSLSHELRTPLTAITGWSETLLNSDELEEDTRRGVKIILREGKRMTEMVVELLDFTKIQDGRMHLNMEMTDIRSEFEDTVYMYGSRLDQEGITLDYDPDDNEIPEISCDPKRMRQVFLNILDNAAKHGGEGKRIRAGICTEESQVVIRIRDFGPGIPEDELQLVKKKFYKGSSKVRGSGIGLAVCEEIVAMHSGSLTIENAPGGGTLVTVRLPIAV